VISAEINPDIAFALVSLLQVDGLRRGNCTIIKDATVEFVLDVKNGTKPKDFLEAFRSAHPEIPEDLASIIQENIRSDSIGQLVLEIPLRSGLKAVNLRHFANQGGLTMKPMTLDGSSPEHERTRRINCDDANRSCRPLGHSTSPISAWSLIETKHLRSMSRPPREFESNLSPKLPGVGPSAFIASDLEGLASSSVVKDSGTKRQPVGDDTALLAAIVESSNDAIVSKDLDGTIRTWNQAAVRLFGYSEAEAVGQPITILIPEGRHDEEPDILRAIRNGIRIEQYETVRRHKDGTLIDVSLTVSPVKNSSGTIVGASKIVRDIRERKLAEVSMRELAAIVESSEDAIVGKSLDGTIKSWNAGAERLFGYRADEVIGRSITLLIPDGRQNEEPDILSRVRRGEPVEHYETVRQRKDGTLVPISLTVSPVRDNAGRIIGASKIARDVSEIKAATRLIEIERDKAIAATRAKDDFLAALSHELRTPLNPVLLLATHAAEDHSLPGHIREDFELIRKNVELEARLIDDLLDITHISRGKIQLNLQNHNLHAVLTDAITTTKADIASKDLTLICQFAPDPLVVCGDAVRLQQVFWNILKNAAKFTPVGGKIVVKTRNDDFKRNAVIEISDTGIGMTEAELSRVFNAFAQGDHATLPNAHRFGGLGLGMAISHKLATLHHGVLSAKSEGRGKGATFELELPLVSPADQRAAAKAEEVIVPPFSVSEAVGRNLRILLVEDHEPTRVTLARLLIRRNFEVVSASSAKEAVAAASKGRIDLVVSDIGLPDATGYELLALLRNGRPLRAIALTGYGNSEDLARSKAAGFSTHLVKPVAIAALDTALAAVFAEPAV
jgi:PAS domain S-box-containing protein